MAKSREPRYLIDSDVLVGFYNKNDSHHHASREILNHFRSHEIDFVVTQFVISEVATVLSHKISQAAAAQFISSSRYFPQIFITEEVFARGLDLFSRQKAKGASVVDSLNVAVLAHFGLTAICSFDMAYEKQYGVPVYSLPK